MKQPVFLTGATGFLGMEVLARLLEAGDREVIALIRASDDAAAEDRLHGVLGALYRDPSNHRDRVRAVAGDVTSPGLGLENGKRTALAEEVGAVLHCAASIAFDLPLDEARKINVEGTREVIGFARECKSLGRLERFVHVSTAYVSGKYEGTFRERQLDAGQEFRNTYEQTKWEAEHVVREADDLSPCIARPSIVMGESDTGWTPAFNVLYWPLRAFSRGLFDEIPGTAERPHRHRPGRLRGGLPGAPARRRRGGRLQPRRRPRGAGRQRARRARVRPLRPAAPGRRRGRWAGRGRGLHAVLRHGHRVRRRPRARRARAGRHPPAAARGLLRPADGLRRDREVGQAVDDARGGAASGSGEEAAAA